MTEILFYHLERAPLEDVLPGLLEKCLERSWRVVVQAGSEERVIALDAHLWSYRDEAFLPHGTAREGNAAAQPIWLTSGDENPNSANVRFLVDGAKCDDMSAYHRVVQIFDSRDADAVSDARSAWKSAQASGHTVTYWQQGEGGRWVKKA
ncbi:MAG: DNA polymerase III subunit chi [Bauldia sp.]